MNPTSLPAKDLLETLEKVASQMGTSWKPLDHQFNTSYLFKYVLLKAESTVGTEGELFPLKLVTVSLVTLSLGLNRNIYILNKQTRVKF